MEKEYRIYSFKEKWMLIAYHLPGRTNHSCMKCFAYIRRQPVREPRWPAGMQSWYDEQMLLSLESDGEGPA